MPGVAGPAYGPAHAHPEPRHPRHRRASSGSRPTHRMSPGAAMGAALGMALRRLWRHEQRAAAARGSGRSAELRDPRPVSLLAALPERPLHRGGCRDGYRFARRLRRDDAPGELPGRPHRPDRVEQERRLQSWLADDHVRPRARPEEVEPAADHRSRTLARGRRKRPRPRCGHGRAGAVVGRTRCPFERRRPARTADPPRAQPPGRPPPRGGAAATGRCHRRDDPPVGRLPSLSRPAPHRCRRDRGAPSRHGADLR